MSQDIASKVIARVEKMADANEEFEGSTLQEFATTIQYLVRERSRKEEVLALASGMFALGEFKEGIQKRIDYATIGGMQERKATLLEILDEIDKDMEVAAAMKIQQHTHHETMANEIKQAILEHLEPTLGHGQWHAREQEAILKVISNAMEGYLVIKTGE